MAKNIKEEIKGLMPKALQEICDKGAIDFSKLIEIRIRVGKPVICIYDRQEYYIDKNKGITKHYNNAYIISSSDVKELMQYVCNYSLYAYEHEIKQGFITVKGGHRIGCCGKVVYDNDEIKNISNISYINIRIAHEVIGCSDNIMPYIYDKKNENIYNCLIISSPCCGKTTLLRDIVRNISDGFENIDMQLYIKGINVGVVDERSEIAACYKGVASNNVGIRTDVLDCCDKYRGMKMLLRAMSEQVIAVDEIGGDKDINAIKSCVNSGCKIIATVHGEYESMEESKNKVINEIVESAIFERYILINKKEKRTIVVKDRQGRLMYRC